MTVQWKFTQGVEEYEFAINPNKMSKPHRRFATEGRPIGIGNRMHGMRGRRVPVELTFSGVLNTEAQYDAFRHWVYEVEGHIDLTTHLGQVYEIRLLQFIPTERKRSKLNPWRFEWALRCWVYT